MSLERLEKQWQGWAKRPPSTPAPQAARRLVARLETEPRRHANLPRRWVLPTPAAAVALVAVALVAVALVAVALAVGLTLHEPGPVDVGTVVERPPLREGVVLMWLDPETPLYLTMRPPAPQGDPK